MSLSTKEIDSILALRSGEAYTDFADDVFLTVVLQEIQNPNPSFNQKEFNATLLEIRDQESYNKHLAYLRSVLNLYKEERKE